MASVTKLFVIILLIVLISFNNLFIEERSWPLKESIATLGCNTPIIENNREENKEPQQNQFEPQPFPG